MSDFCYLEVSWLNDSGHAQWSELQSSFATMTQVIGIESYSIAEAKVDQYLETRALSGGTVGQDILDEVELKIQSDKDGGKGRIFFDETLDYVLLMIE